jgi:hypothetical protein
MKIAFVSSVALLGAMSHASAVPVAVYGGTDETFVDTNSPTNQTGGYSVAVTGAGTINPGQVSEPSGGVASGQVTISNQPSIFVMGSTGSLGDHGAGQVFAEGTLTYSFEISGPQPSVSVQVLATGNASFAPAGAGDNDSASASLRISGGPVNGNPSGAISDQAFVDPSITTFSSANFTENGTYLLATNTIYTVALLASVSSNPSVGGFDTLSAFVDPQFIVPIGYSLEFSDGVGNGATTPIPAALPLFLSGLGTMGLLGWRRKRKTQAVA